MDKRYRITISGKKLYKEIEVSQNNKAVRFGTENTCDVRVRKSLFFEPIELTFLKNEQGDWSVICSDNLYIYVDEVRKLMTVPVQHGTELVVKYHNSGSDVLYIRFLIDFDYEIKDYDRRYDISPMGTVSVGAAADNNLIISGPYIGNDKVILAKHGNSLLLDVQSTTYGVYHNGNIIRGQVEIKNGDFFSVANYSFFYKNGNLFTQRKSGIKANGINYADATKRRGYPKFNRNSRIITLLDDTKIEVLDPPAIPKKPKSNLFTRLLPSLIMIVASFVTGFSGGVFILVSIASATAGIVTAIIGVKEANKEYKKEFSDRITKYNTYIDKKRTELDKARLQELTILQDKYISEQQEIDMMKGFSYELFDRCKDDEDFLDVRLGVGKLKAKRIVDYKKQERLEIEDDLQNQPKNLYEQYKYIKNAPIVCNFREANAVGIIGDEHTRFDILKNIIVDICARQYHSDVKMFFVAEQKHLNQIYWFRMLPHVHNDVLGIHNIVCDDSSKAIIFEYLYKELSVREQNKDNMPNIIIYLYDEYGFKSHPLSRFVDNAKDLGVTFVFFGESRADIGLGCRFIIEKSGINTAKLIDTRDSKKTNEFMYNAIHDNDVAAMVQLLAPVYTEEISLESSLTKSISLFELLNIISVDDINLAQRWSESKVYQSMAAPIGVAKNGVIALDLHDKAHGPHGLVAGTTGAGKSELLQTYIISMAALYHPYEVGFVIIDFKGGGMANQFKDLPHMIGTITNIDGKEINRSLKSIKAELKKRQRLFAEMDVNHIDKYIVKFRSGEAKTALPHLILIVDEFAELKADQPEFMKELISAARIGRSLGVHLILATQKPSGQVDEQIWSNSRFKLCLKVQSQQDSNEVLKSPLAAEIKEPGRAYIQVGNNEIFELFQSAYSGAPEHADDSGMKEFTIFEITSSGKRIPVYNQKKKKGDGSDVTQLDAMVQYTKNFCDRSKLKKLPNICLLPLGTMIEFPNSERLSYRENHIVADLGIYDDPDNQVQDMYSVDLSEQNMMIIGSAQSGKTNLLQAIIRSLATKYTPNEVNIYIIDFASMVLKNFEGLNHVGGVVTAAEDEKLKNLFKLLSKEITERKERLLSAGVSSINAYREAGQRDVPQIVLIIDNLTSLNELYFSEDDSLIYVCREGLSLGISVVVANSQTSGISYKYMSNFECKIALHCIESSEYSSLLGAYKVTVDDKAGRGLIEHDKEILDAQMFKAFYGEKEFERNKYISKFIHEINGLNEKEAAKCIPTVPEMLPLSVFERDYQIATDNNSFYLGLNYDGVEPFEIKWIEQTVIGVSGTTHKKAAFTSYIKNSFIACSYELYVIDDYTGEFEDISENAAVKLYSRAIEDTGEILSDIQSELESRNAIRETKGVKSIMEMPPIIILIHNKEWDQYVSSNMEMLTIYKECINKYKGLKCCFVFTNIENDKVNEFQANEVIKTLIKKQRYIVFENVSDIKVFDVMHKEKQKFANPLKAGEAFVLFDNAFNKVKIVSND